MRSERPKVGKGKRRAPVGCTQPFAVKHSKRSLARLPPLTGSFASWCAVDTLASRKRIMDLLIKARVEDRLLLQCPLVPRGLPAPYRDVHTIGIPRRPL